MNKKKILSLIMALVMLVGVFSPLTAFADNANEPTEKTSKEKDAVTKTVTLHKLMMTKDELKAWDSKKVEEDGYNGTQDLTELKKLLSQGHSAKEADNVFFAWQVKGKETTKVQEKDVNQYIKKAADSTATLYKPEIDKAGNPVLTTNIDEAFGGLTANKSGIKFDTSKLKGTFLIQEVKEKSTYIGTETDGKGKPVIVDQKAVPVEITLPLVNNDGTVIDAHVYPKNTEDRPEIDKNFVKDKGLEAAEGFDNQDLLNVGAVYDNYQKEKATAKATVGKEIPYEVKTLIKAGTSYENLTWNDVMTNGLTYNEDLEVTVDNNITLSADTDYTLVQDQKGFRLQLTEAGLKKISDVTANKKGQDGNIVDGKDVKITLTYSATVNGTAVVDEPEKNNVTLEYGHKPGKKIDEKDVKSKDKTLEVDKSFDPVLDDKAKDKLVLAYTLKEGKNVIGTVALTKDNSVGDKINLGNGIVFEVTGEFKGKFTGLENTKTYKFSERVAGYNPEYTKIENGKVTIKNNKDNDNPPPLNPTEPKVVVGGKKFVKTNQDGTERLAGAKFVVKGVEGVNKDKYLAVKSVDTVEAEKTKLANAKAALDTAVKNYNERKDDTNKDTLAEAIKTAQKDYNDAFKTAGTRYEWADSKDETGKTIVTLVSNKDGQFMIEGLEYGKYKLEEIEAPKGFAKRNDLDFTIAKGDTTDVDIKYEGTEDANNAKKVENKTVTIPQTGGMGTVLFTVVGISLMAGAVIAMKRNREEA